jgi:polysaccharide export outer membrane protein
MRKQKESLLGLRQMSRAVAPCAWALGLLLGMLSQAAVAQQTSGVQKMPAASGSTTGDITSQSDARYRIGPGDVLEIRVYNRPQLSREAVRVEGNGMIRMPLIEGEVQAACRTESELSQAIARLYLEYQKNPQVDVYVKEYNSQPVAVIGAVNAPGRFQLQRRVRLLELLTFAGGPAERAGRTIQIIHNAPASICELPGSSPGASETFEVSSYKMNDLLQGDVRSNPYVRPGDVVTITEAEQIYVIGNVLKPSTLPLKDKVTVSQAIAMAGGTLPDTQSNRVRIIRQNAGRKTEMIVDLKAINKQSAEDVVLQANDVVEVPTASGKRFLRNLLGSIIPSAARLPVQIIR